MFDLDGSYTISKIASTKNDRAKKLRIYPNPASGVLVVEARENLSPQLSKITDLNGKIINCPILNDPLTFDISQLQPGVYFLFVNEEIQNLLKNRSLEIKLIVKYFYFGFLKIIDRIFFLLIFLQLVLLTIIQLLPFYYLEISETALLGSS